MAKRSFLDFAGKALSEHAFVAALGAAGTGILNTVIEKGGERVKKEVVKKFGRESRIEGMTLLSRAMYDTDLTPEDRAGAQTINLYYASLDEDAQERMERLIGDSWSAWCDGFGGTASSLTGKTTVIDKKTGKSTTTEKYAPNKTLPNHILFMKHWTGIANLGVQFIELELKKIDRGSPVGRVVRTAKKVGDTVNRAGDRAAGAFADVIAGFMEGGL